ncbi:MAG: FAD-dependent oxidoreductase, partial [Traorella sp.]
PPTHKHPSSPKYDAGNSFVDKSASGAAGIIVPTGPVGKNGEYGKYDKDQIRELMSMAGQTGSKVGTQVGMFGVDFEKKIQYSASDNVTWDGKQLYELPVEKMDEMLEDLRRSVVAARKFGFDYIQFHMAHESILSHFMSPVLNRRVDEYGGSLENRMRFPLRCIDTIREAAGEGMPVIVRLSSVLHCKESYSFEDMLELIKRMQGKVDIINTSCGMDTWNNYEVNIYHCTTPFQEHGINLKWAERIKEACPDLYVCPVGGFTDPDFAEKAIADGKCDAIMLGRAMNADPYWPKKVKENRPEDITPCLRCSYCYHAASDHDLIACSVNPRYFRENRVPLHLEPASIKKKVVIIGGGPAGCVAAINADARGHEVILLEKSNELGGQIKHAIYDHHKSDLAAYLSYLRVQIAKSNVKVYLNTLATKEMITQLHPDVVIVAIGAKPIKPNIKGIENAKEAIDMLYHIDDVKENVAIIGGGSIGSELALQLAEMGRKVTLVEATNLICANQHKLYRLGIKEAMSHVQENIDIRLNSLCTEINEHSITIKNEKGELETIEADDILYSVGLRNNKDENYEFYGICDETYEVGDCDRVAKVLEAVNKAYFIAVNL